MSSNYGSSSGGVVEASSQEKMIPTESSQGVEEPSRGRRRRDGSNNDDAIGSIAATGVTRKRKADALGRVTDSLLGRRKEDNNGMQQPSLSMNQKNLGKMRNTSTTTTTTRRSTGSNSSHVATAAKASASASVVGGRGCTAGWTTCPLCGKYSSKRYAIGRGISNHLHAIHTPWKPSKMVYKIRRRQQEEQQREEWLIQRTKQKQCRQQLKDTNTKKTKSNNNETTCQHRDEEGTLFNVTSLASKRPAPTQDPKESTSCSALVPWEPTPQEVEDWDAQVLGIINQIESDHYYHQQQHQHEVATKTKDTNLRYEKDNDKNTPNTTTTTNNNNRNTNSRSSDNPAEDQSSSSMTTKNNDVVILVGGKNRSGQDTQPYRQSLPPFIQAAADGDLSTIQSMINDASSYEKEEAEEGGDSGDGDGVMITVDRVPQLLDTRDRHLSTAEHWAAGGGHLKCLTFLMNLRQKYDKKKNVVKYGEYEEDSSSKTKKSDQQQTTRITTDYDDEEKAIVPPAAAIVTGPKKKMRRRDGKTCLHYAARNGQLTCIKYLLHDCSYYQPQQQNSNITTMDVTSNTLCNQSRCRIRSLVNEPSGDRTTPVHMACYGGHATVVQYLIEQGADVHASNDWGCTAAHWAGMTISTDRCAIRKLCNLLQQVGVSFSKKQSQGHSPLHKAAQRLNRHVIEWMAAEQEKQGINKDTIAGHHEANGKSVDGGGGAGLSAEEKQLAGGPDLGGHLPNEIWRSVGGDSQFADWMKEIAPGW